MDIFEAISLNLSSEVRESIRAGANLEASNSRGVEPIVAALDAAVRWREPTILQLLRGAGAKSAPLLQAIEGRLRLLPVTLLDEHNSTTQAINDTVDRLKGKESQLADDERVRLKAFLTSSTAFDATSQSLRDQLLTLSERVSRRDDTVLDAAVGYLIEVAGFQADAMRLRMDSVTIAP
jgi:hypothetical protein